MVGMGGGNINRVEQYWTEHFNYEMETFLVINGTKAFFY